jgi:hypothetical protein
MHRRTTVAALLAALLIAGSACQPPGGSSPPAASSPRAAPSPAGTGQSGSRGDEDAKFCALAKQTGAANLEVFDAQSSTPEQLRQVLANIDALTAAAPPAIHADFVRFDTFEHKLFDAGGNASGDLAQEAGGPELRDALQRIANYLAQHCDIHS